MDTWITQMLSTELKELTLVLTDLFVGIRSWLKKHIYIHAAFYLTTYRHINKITYAFCLLSTSKRKIHKIGHIYAYRVPSAHHELMLTHIHTVALSFASMHNYIHTHYL